jgi:hypothetical protein
VIHSSLQTLHSHLVDMHTQYPKIEEDTEFPKVLSVKQNLETPENLNKEIDSVATILLGLKPR